MNGPGIDAILRFGPVGGFGNTAFQPVRRAIEDDENFEAG